MAKTRNITKSLAAMEDLLRGVGTLEQTRNKLPVTVHKTDLPVPLATEVDLKALDVTEWSYARVYASDRTYKDYWFDATATSGIAPDVGTGFWVRRNSSDETVRVADYTALRALPARAQPDKCLVSGYSGVGNGGGVFYYDPSDTTTADDDNLVIVDSSGRRWKRLLSGGMVQAEELANSGIALVACTIRQNATTPTQWDYVTAGPHVPVGVDLTVPPTAAGDVITLTLRQAYTSVIALTATPDETFAEDFAMSCGPSVGTGTIALHLSSYFGGAAEVHYDGANYVVTNEPGSSLFTTATAVSANTVRVSHNYCAGERVTLTMNTRTGAILNPFAPVIKDIQPNHIDVQFIDPSTGSVFLTLPSTRVSFSVEKRHTGNLNVDGTSLDLTGGNIWILGVFQI